MKINRYLMSLIIIGLAVVTGFYLGGQSNKFSPATSAELLFQQNFVTSQGTNYPLGHVRGKIIVVNFWATWCPPCLEEMPELSELQHQFKDKNVQFIGIGVDTADNIKAFVAKNKSIDYPLLISGNTGIELSRMLGNSKSGLPYTVIINSQGRVIFHHAGRISTQQLVEHLQPY